MAYVVKCAGCSELQERKGRRPTGQLTVTCDRSECIRIGAEIHNAAIAQHRADAATARPAQPRRTARTPYGDYGQLAAFMRRPNNR